MTVYLDKKRNRWRYDFELGGRRYAQEARDPITDEPVTSKRAAQMVENAARAAAKIAPKLPRAGDTTLALVVAALLPEWKLQPHWTNRVRYVNEIVRHFGEDTIVSEISGADVDDYVSEARTKPVMQWRGGPNRDPLAPEHARFWKPSGRTRSAATMNLYLSVLRKVFERALKIVVAGEVALKVAPDVPYLKVPKRKARPIPDEVLSFLMEILPQHVIEAMVVTLFFGFRRNEALTLEAHQVDFERRGVMLFAEGVKDAEDAFLPADPRAIIYLRRLVDQAHDRGQRRLITWRPYRKDPAEQAKIAWRPLKRPKGAWRRAMNEVEAKFGRRWRWHDIRASFITYVAQTSGQLAAQTLARHESYATTKMYVEAADDFTRAAAVRAAGRPSLSLVTNESPTEKPTRPTKGQRHANAQKR